MRFSTVTLSVQLLYKVREHSLTASLVKVPSNNGNSFWMSLNLFVNDGIQLRERYANISIWRDTHSSNDPCCELSGHVKGSTLYSHYFQIGRAVRVYDPTACTLVHMNMNKEPLSSALTGAFIPVEEVHGAAS